MKSRLDETNHMRRLMGLPLLTEQGFTLLGTSNPVRSRFDLSKGGSTRSGKRLPTPEDGVDAIDPIIGGSSERDKEDMVKDLFNKLSKSPTYKLYIPKNNEVYSSASSVYYILEFMDTLKESMEGIGNNKVVLKVLNSLDSKELATIIKYWEEYTGSDESLYEWLDGEWGLSWDEVWDSMGDFKNEMGIELYKKYSELS